MLKSICIVRLSALGDVLMLTPLVRTLQTHLPNAQLTWVISPPAYDLVAGLDGVEFIVVDKPSALSDFWQFRKRLRGRHFDVLLAAQASFRANLLYPLISATRKIGYDKPRAKDGHHWFINETIFPGQDHTLEGFLKFAKALGIEQQEIRWDLPIASEDRDWALAHLPKGRVLLVNAAASKPERSWLVERYVAVIKAAQERWQVTPVLIGGPSAYDRQLADVINQHLPCHDLVGKTTLKQLLAVISQAEVLLCPDTGPSHMAAAVNTPVVALHAVTSTKVSGPYTYRHLAVDCYPEAVKTILKQTLDTTPWGTHAHGADTMKLVPVDAVLAKLAEVLGPFR